MDEKMHEGVWVKVKCWACEGGKTKEYTPAPCQRSLMYTNIQTNDCKDCRARGWLMQFVCLKPDKPGSKNA